MPANWIVRRNRLAVEPASQEDFDGYLTFTGTVDPSTLALTPAPGGTGIETDVAFPR